MARAVDLLAWTLELRVAEAKSLLRAKLVATEQHRITLKDLTEEVRRVATIPPEL